MELQLLPIVLRQYPRTGFIDGEFWYAPRHLFSFFFLYIISLHFFRFVLFYFISFHFILFYFILFYFILFYFILFYFILFYFILFYFILFYFILFYSGLAEGSFLIHICCIMEL